MTLHLKLCNSEMIPINSKSIKLQEIARTNDTLKVNNEKYRVLRSLFLDKTFRTSNPNLGLTACSFHILLPEKDYDCKPYETFFLGEVHIDQPKPLEIELGGEVITIHSTIYPLVGDLIALSNGKITELTTFCFEDEKRKITITEWSNSLEDFRTFPGSFVW